MPTTSNLPESRSAQGCAAGSMVGRRLPSARREDAAGGRVALRSGGDSRRPARPRRRDGNGQCRARGGAARVRRRRGRLRATAARSCPGPGGRRGARRPVRRRRRRAAALPRCVVRRRAVGVRSDVRARPAPRRPRVAPRLSAGRADRDGELDARPRTLLRDRRRIRATSRRDRLAAALGNAGNDWRSSSREAPRSYGPSCGRSPSTTLRRPRLQTSTARRSARSSPCSRDSTTTTPLRSGTTS